MNENIKEVAFKEALLIFLVMVAFLAIGVGILKVDLHVVLLASLFFVVFWSYKKGYSWKYMKDAMGKSIERVFDAMLIFILIGAIIGVWIKAGTVPSLIYYGLKILSPKIFLPAGLIICSITSLVTGTSWGTIGTIGIALMGIGESLGIPIGLTAGMIVSGAFFGDKISPISDTTNLAAASTETNLYEHIGAMLYTTIPSYIIAFIIYTVLGLKYGGGTIDYSQINLIQSTLSSHFNISIFTLIPMIVVVILSIKKKPAVPVMAIGVILGVVVALIFQGANLTSAINSINRGYVDATGVEIVDRLLLRGGIQSMMNTFSLAFIALCLGGLLEEIGYLEVLVGRILKGVKKVGSLVLVTIISLILSNAVMGEAYLSIILNGKMYKKTYEKMGLQSRMLSRTLEEGGTLTTALIPWTTAGAFVTYTLGIDTIKYLPYTFFNLINPIVAILCAYIGIFVLRKKKSVEK